MGYVVRRLAPNEISLAVEGAALEGWNPGRHDAECFAAADPNGFFVGELDGEPIATASAVIYDDHFAFFGLYRVQPEYRHQGYGIQLTRARLAYVGGRSVGLDGVVTMQDKYAQIGFRWAHRNIRFTRTIKQAPTLPSGPARLVPAIEVDMEALNTFDRLHFGAPRQAFVDRWIRSRGAIAFAAMDHGQLRGWIAARACRVGYKIGPLFAERPDIAEYLLLATLARLEEQEVALDVPETNRAAVSLARKMGMTAGFETARMYLGPPPDLPMDQIFGITTMELG